MKLDDWLWANKTRQSAFAIQLGISKGYLSDLCAGNRQPSLRLAQQIALCTAGQVMPHDFFNVSEPPEATQ
jgi:DNA-binding transcriptional regulator YdaS (Cro superfamily)